MYPLPDLEYLIDLASLDVRFQPLVRRFRLFLGVVLALLLCHLPAMYRARFVPVFHNPTTSPKNHDKHRHKCRCEYHSINDEAQPYYSFCHPITLLFSSRGFLSHASAFCNWHGCFCRQIDDLVRRFFNGFNPFLFHRFRILPNTFT